MLVEQFQCLNLKLHIFKNYFPMLCIHHKQYYLIIHQFIINIPFLLYLHEMNNSMPSNFIMKLIILFSMMWDMYHLFQKWHSNLLMTNYTYVILIKMEFCFEFLIILIMSC